MCSWDVHHHFIILGFLEQPLKRTIFYLKGLSLQLGLIAIKSKKIPSVRARTIGNCSPLNGLGEIRLSVKWELGFWSRWVD